jgi:HEPN domain-containing protein
MGCCSMSAEKVIASYLRVAREDLEGARLLAAKNNRNAVYLCEQAAEKIIKAVLTSENVRGGIKHLLDELVSQVPDENPIKPALRAIEHLAAYATAYRYPTPSGRIQQGPANLELEIDRVDAALREAAKRFGVDLGHADTPAISAGPIR